MSENPFESRPVTDDADNVADEADLHDTVVVLRQTKPWVRLMSVIMALVSALMVLLGIVLMAGMAGNVGPFGGFGAVIGVVYLLMALIYIVPAIFLWKYADGIAEFVHDRSVMSLAYALEAQKSYWKFVGILTLIVLVLYAGLFLIGILRVVMGAM